MRLVRSPSPKLQADFDLGCARHLIAGSAGSGAQEVLRSQMVDFVDTHPDALLRSCVTGHLTGSAFVINHSGSHALLLLHTKLGKWLQPGGHADGDGNLVHVAWREATEETGIAGLAVMAEPLDLDIHEVRPPHESAHDHLDVRFVIVAPPDAVAVTNHESREMRWVARDDLTSVTHEVGLHRLANASFGWADRWLPALNGGTAGTGVRA